VTSPRILVALVVALATFLCALFVPAPYFPAAQLLLSAALAVSTAGLVYVIISPDPMPVTLVCNAYLSMFFLVPGIGHLSIGRFPFFNQNYSQEIVLQAAVITVVFVFLFTGATLSYRKSRDREPPRPEPAYRFWPAISANLFLALACVAVVGYEAFHIARGESVPLSPLELVLFATARVGSFVALCLAFLALVQQRSLLSYVLIVPAILCFFAANDIIALPRFISGAYVIAFIFLFLRITRLFKLLFVVAVAAGQISLFPLVSEISRGSGSLGQDYDPIAYLFKNGDFDGFQSVINVASFVDRAGLQGGRQLLSAALFFVPRDLVPWKSIGTGGDAGTSLGLSFVNLSAPMPAELYVDFGYVGLVVLTVLLALGIRAIDDGFGKARQGSFGRLLGALTAGFALILMRGSLVGVMGPISCAIGLWALSNALARPPASMDLPRHSRSRLAVAPPRRST
jgi:hypothetical protein